MWSLSRKTQDTFETWLIGMNLIDKNHVISVNGVKWGELTIKDKMLWRQVIAIYPALKYQAISVAFKEGSLILKNSGGEYTISTELDKMPDLDGMRDLIAKTGQSMSVIPKREESRTGSVVTDAFWRI